MNKHDLRILKRGLRRTVLALVTEIVFALTVFDLVLTARAPGYLAVLMFLASIQLAVATVVLLYAQGLPDGVHIESVVDSE